MKASKILALDIATQLGYKSTKSSGSVSFSNTKKKNDRCLLFYNWLKVIVTEEEITHIVYERVAGTHKNALIVMSKMVGCMELLCAQLEITNSQVPSKTVKKFATNNGNANKQDMITAAISLGFNPIDDNEADAIHIYNYYKNNK